VNKIDRLYQGQYKYEQYQFKTPPDLLESMYQQMKQYQQTHGETSIELEATTNPTQVTRNLTSILVLIGTGLVAAVVYYLLVIPPIEEPQSTSPAFSPEPAPSQPLPEEESNQLATAEVIGSTEEEVEETLVRPSTPAEEDQNNPSPDRLPNHPNDESFRLIIRPPSREE